MDTVQLRMMLLIGMKTNLIMYPTNPMTTNPSAQLPVILRNSFLSGFSHLLRNMIDSLKNYLVLSIVEVT